MTTINLSNTMPRESLRLKNTTYLPHEFFKNMTLEFLQLLFQSREVGNYKWDADDIQTEIMIVDKNTYNLETVGKRPAFIVNRGRIGWTNSSGIGNMLSVDFKTGSETFTDLLSGSVTVYSLSRNGLEAENLAFWVFWCFKTFKKVLKKIGFFKINSAEMGQETQVLVDSKPELVMIPVTISMLIQDKWIVEPSNATRMSKLIFEHLTQR
jgi:hypothetical protein